MTIHLKERLDNQKCSGSELVSTKISNDLNKT